MFLARTTCLFDLLQFHSSQGMLNPNLFQKQTTCSLKNKFHLFIRNLGVCVGWLFITSTENSLPILVLRSEL